MSVEKKQSAKERILEAAAQVFAAEGIKGATTREIVRVAGVNESTLFRNFQSKDELLKAVIDSTVEEMGRVLADIEISPKSLREDLLHYAQASNAHMEKNEAIIRMLMGEMERQPEHAQRIVESAKQPLVEMLTAYFEAKQKQNLVRSDIPLPIILDLFSGMLLAGVLKRPITSEKYSTEAYLKSLVEIFHDGIAL